jgi:hypothetical protein
VLDEDGEFVLIRQEELEALITNTLMRLLMPFQYHEFGNGKVIISVGSQAADDENKCAFVGLRNVEEVHEVGAELDCTSEEVKPKEGDTVLAFTNAASARTLIGMITKACEFAGIDLTSS